MNFHYFPDSTGFTSRRSEAEIKLTLYRSVVIELWLMWTKRVCSPALVTSDNIKSGALSRDEADAEDDDLGVFDDENLPGYFDGTSQKLDSNSAEAPQQKGGILYNEGNAVMKNTMKGWSFLFFYAFQRY